MAINPTAFKAYDKVASLAKDMESGKKTGRQENPENNFTQTLQDSLAKVNDLQQEKSKMIEAFATGEKQNVHELMITLQKAGLAMSLTSAVRNKVMEAYKELMRMTF